MSGEVGILNVGAGDTKLVFDPKKPADRARAAKVVEDMLRRGYALLVQVGKRNGEPVYQRAKAFDPKRCEYIVAGAPDETVYIGSERAPAKRGRARRIPAEGTNAVAVARTSGG